MIQPARSASTLGRRVPYSRHVQSAIRQHHFPRGLREGSTGVHRHRSGWLATSESVISAGAIAGSVGLIQGSIDLGVAINNRLPFESPVFAGGALFVIVATPMTIAVGAAPRGASNPARFLRAHVTFGPCDAPYRVPRFSCDIRTQDRECGRRGCRRLWSLGAPSALALGRNR